MGTIRNRRTQLTALRPAMGVGMAGVISALLASQISLELAPSVSRALFAVLLVAAAVRLGHTGWVSLREDAGSVSDPPAAPEARQSVVSGNGVSARVDPGGPRMIQTKQQ